MDISSIDAANAVLPQFITAWNTRFAVEPRDESGAHCPWNDTADALHHKLARRDERTLSKALTFRAEGTISCVRIRDAGIALRHHLDGTLTIHHKDRILPVTAFRTYPVPDAAKDGKTIDLRIDHIVAARRSAAPRALEVGRG